MGKFVVGPPVLRKDDPQQRFYVPVSRVEPLDGAESQIVLRVASDAFLDEAGAVEFGKFVEQALNGYDPHVGAKYLIKDKAEGSFLEYNPRYSEARFGCLDRATKFSSMESARKAASWYTNKKNRRNINLRVLTMVRYNEDSSQDELPEQFETVLGEND